MAHGYLGDGYGSHGDIDPDRDDDRERSRQGRNEDWRDRDRDRERGSMFGDWDRSRSGEDRSNDRELRNERFGRQRLCRLLPRARAAVPQRVRQLAAAEIRQSAAAPHRNDPDRHVARSERNDPGRGGEFHRLRARGKRDRRRDARHQLGRPRRPALKPGPLPLSRFAGEGGAAQPRRVKARPSPR